MLYIESYDSERVNTLPWDEWANEHARYYGRPHGAQSGCGLIRESVSNLISSALDARRRLVSDVLYWYPLQPTSFFEGWLRSSGTFAGILELDGYHYLILSGRRHSLREIACSRWIQREYEVIYRTQAPDREPLEVES